MALYMLDRRMLERTFNSFFIIISLVLAFLSNISVSPKSSMIYTSGMCCDPAHRYKKDPRQEVLDGEGQD